MHRHNCDAHVRTQHTCSSEWNVSHTVSTQICTKARKGNCHVSTGSLVKSDTIAAQEPPSCRYNIALPEQLLHLNGSNSIQTHRQTNTHKQTLAPMPSRQLQSNTPIWQQTNHSHCYQPHLQKALSLDPDSLRTSMAHRMWFCGDDANFFCPLCTHFQCNTGLSP